MLNELFGPSLHISILDMFLENNDELMNLREIARRVDKNPGSVYRVLPTLLENDFIEQVPISQSSNVYRLKKENKIVKLIIEFNNKLKDILEE
ncbi:MAG: helix-turn-helix domain-containing protein [Candidatus Lokiarchaeota archaeon]|nr:helix-turn-helix domain-containing protein [Candidatus Lokiarchaeota archaeon]